MAYKLDNLNSLPLKKEKELVKYENINLSTGEFREGYFPVDNLKKGSKQKWTKVFDMKKPIFSTPVYEGYLIRLLPYLELETNKLVAKGKFGLENITRKDLQKLIGNNIDGKIVPVSRQTAYKFLKEAEEKKVIVYSQKEKAFYVNPSIAMKGNKIVDGVKKLFKE